MGLVPWMMSCNNQSVSATGSTSDSVVAAMTAKDSVLEKNKATV